jgi:hypothetical protein
MRFDTTTASIAIAGLAGLASAFPSEPMRFSKREQASAADIILAIAPKSGDCDGASFADECATNVQAAPHLINAMFAYELYEPAQIGAVLAVQALESGEFKYNRNHFPEPGRPGQGSRNMQMISYNLLYAQSKDEFKDKLPSGDADSLSDDDKNAVLALVMEEPYTWETGPWFLATQCDQSVRDTLASDPDAGWTAYMACIGVESNEEREVYWNNAKKAFGLS